MVVGLVPRENIDNIFVQRLELLGVRAVVSTVPSELLFLLEPVADEGVLNREVGAVRAAVFRSGLLLLLLSKQGRTGSLPLC